MFNLELTIGLVVELGFGYMVRQGGKVTYVKWNLKLAGTESNRSKGLV